MKQPRGRRPALVVALLLVLVAACSGGTPSTEGKPATIAFLRAVAGAPSTEPAFVAELAANGFRKGENLTILASDANEAYPTPEAARAAVGRWIAQGVDIIVALSSGGAAAARAAAPDVNVLFLSNDPVATGLVKNETAPEGRSTGVTFRVPADRTLSLATRTLGMQRFGLAYPAGDPAALANRDALTTAGGKLGLQLLTAEFTTAAEVPAAVAKLAADGAQALVISTSPIATRALAETTSAAGAHRLPLVANTSLVAGAVVSLYPDSEELGRQLGRQASRLLSETAPRSIPVEDPRRFLVTINQKAATDLGIVIPDAVLREANNVTR
jgi:putative ABC transport system substrate-binding protein